jgi:hypothetical protein
VTEAPTADPPVAEGPEQAPNVEETKEEGPAKVGIRLLLSADASLVCCDTTLPLPLLCLCDSANCASRLRRPVLLWTPSQNHERAVGAGRSAGPH